MNTRLIKIIALCALATLIGFSGLLAQSSDYLDLKRRAEKLYAEGSFAKAHDLYEQAKSFQLTPDEARWVAFRNADTLWRSQAGTAAADNTLSERARHELEVLVRDVTLAGDHDRVWAEVQESLGDFFWTRREAMNWGEAWPYYQKALDWWAGAQDIELARQRYLRIVWTIARPPRAEPLNYSYGMYGNFLPFDILENVLKIAQTENDKAHAHYLLAMTLRQGAGAWEQFHRVPQEFEAAIKLGKQTEWYDDALFNYAEWMVGQGRPVRLKDGGWTREPDYPKALELFRRFVRDYQKGESRYYESAQQQIRNITDVQLGVGVANIFLPDSEIQFSLNWRNVSRIEFALYPVDLTRVNLSGADENRNDWLQGFDLAGRESVKTWTRETHDDGHYKPGAEMVRLDKKLQPGAYVLEAESKGKRVRDLVLVTDASVVLKTSGRQALVYFCNALTGSPLAEARIQLWERYHDGKRWQWRESSKNANADGIAVFDLVAANSEQVFALANLKNRQAFSILNTYNQSQPREEAWKIYAFTDRPAYRPKETVQWKFIARSDKESVYSTPSGQVIEYQINDPRGTKLKEDKATLNAFGSAWGSVELSESAPLGEYQVMFWSPGRARHLGSASLFRVEEYKLPEFKVSVQTPEENGRKRAFRLGEKVTVNIQADYYFGGPVANATVELLVYQNPFYHIWHRPHPYPWYYGEESSPFRRGRYFGGGQEQVLKRETLKTDLTGKASLTFDTPAGMGQDLEYKIEARVTDASRREIVGTGEVRVTRQRYYVYPHAEHNIHRPQDKVTIEFKAVDANEQPVQAEGMVKVTRDYWYEVWLDPNGREVKGKDLQRIRQTSMVFPPPGKPNDRPWQFKFQGYEKEEILTRSIKTDTNGMGLLTFTPEREGYYRIAWSSEEDADTNAPPAPPIEAETTVWVARNTTTELGYRSGGVQIIVDRDTFRVGQKTPVMLSVPTNDRYVLFSVEGADLYSYQLVHLTGDVKLVELAVEEKHVPNIFLSAALVSDRQMFIDTKEVIVPPTKNFLTVNVKADREQYRPQEEGVFTITTLDHENKPVSAEVSFGLVDESVYYIQQEYAGDPRQFYFGTKRSHQVQTQSTFNQKSYAKLVEGERNELIDERDREMAEKAVGVERFRDSKKDKDSYYAAGRRSELSLGMAVESGAIGGMGGGGARMLGSVMNAPAASAAKSAMTRNRTDALQEMSDKPGAAQEPAVQVRTDFRSTVVWKPDVMTGADGKATIRAKYPDSMTGWRATARAVTEVNQFGIASTNTRTKQPLIVRLQAPRFFVVGDLVTISAVINNNTATALEVFPKLDAEGVVISGLYVSTNGIVKGERAASVKVEANGEARMDWAITVGHPGTARLKVTAKAGEYADAMERNYTIYEHGIEKLVSKSGKVRGDDVSVKLNIPKERKIDSTTLTVQVTPSLAVTMLDALPYLIDYPYGCTEQTMSRFLPAAITAKTLRDLGLKPEEVMSRVFGGVEQASAAATHPDGKHDLKKLNEMVEQGLQRLHDFQHEDGGWGWWKEGQSDHFMTAYVVWGLALARSADVATQPEVLERGARYLDKTLVEEELNYDMQAWMLHALAVYHSTLKKGDVGQFQAKAFENLWSNREKLNAYTRALLALSAHHLGFADKAKILVENLENGVIKDNKPDTSVVMRMKLELTDAPIGTAHWGEDGVYWRWSDGGVEATAFALRALLAIDPKNKLIEPVTNWLIKNRRGAQWSNTRDTAITVLTMNDYLRMSGELSPELEYELIVNDQSIATKKVEGGDVFSAPSQYDIESKLIRDGTNDIRIVRRGGKGPIYFAASARFFSLEEPITPAGNEIFVRRQYYKLVGRPTLLKGYVYDRQPLNDGGTVQSGDRVETVLTIEAKNNYEYLVFEDLKPAGLEAVAVRSGEPLYALELKSGAVERKFTPKASSSSPAAAAPKLRAPGRRGTGFVASIPRPNVDEDQDHTGRSRWVYEELRDRKVALFIDKLPQGVWEIKYSLRAEVPGQFHALPVVGHAMYVPEIRCNGAEVRVSVEDGK